MGKKHKKGNKRSKSPKVQPKTQKPSLKWLYVAVAVVVGIWLISSLVGGSDYPAKITEKPLRGGDENAPVLLEEFSDLQCPACRQMHPILQQIVDDYDGQVAWRFYHFPLTSIHPYARTAAVGAECAADQGIFWEYIDTVYENQQNIRKGDLINYATELGADATFEDCINSNTKNGIVESEVNEGVRRNVRGTPTVFVNGRQVQGLGYDAIAAAIDAELN